MATEKQAEEAPVYKEITHVILSEGAMGTL